MKHAPLYAPALYRCLKIFKWYIDEGKSQMRYPHIVSIPHNMQKNQTILCWNRPSELLRRYSTRDQDPLLGRGSIPNVRHITL